MGIMKKLASYAAAVSLSVVTAGMPAFAANSSTAKYVDANNRAIYASQEDVISYAEAINRYYHGTPAKTEVNNSSFYEDAALTRLIVDEGTDAIAYTYDANNNIIQSADLYDGDTTVTTFAYDGHNVMTARSVDGTAYGYTPTYDASHRLIQSAINDGSIVNTYKYDKYGRVSDAAQQLDIFGMKSTFTYHYTYKSNRLTKISWKNGAGESITTTLHYDKNKRLTSASEKSANGTSNYVLNYNKNGSLANAVFVQPINAEDNIYGYNGPLPYYNSRTYSFGY